MLMTTNNNITAVYHSATENEVRYLHIHVVYKLFRN